ncbi:MAG TPA: metalloregulator ArsR/SmtB family transcription factor [Bacillota bacterium]|nr:metalloregulator ArsR/SmtB family transcription factor [Bacillota bacterium]
MQGWETQLNKERAIIFKALAHTLRLAIVDELQKGECCVQDLVQRLGCEQSNLSRHLAVLKRAGIVDCEKKGLFVYYSLVIPCINGFFSCVNQVLSKRVQEKRGSCHKL